MFFSKTCPPHQKLPVKLRVNLIVPDIIITFKKDGSTNAF